MVTPWLTYRRILKFKIPGGTRVARLTAVTLESIRMRDLSNFRDMNHWGYQTVTCFTLYYICMDYDVFLMFKDDLRDAFCIINIMVPSEFTI